jgi:ribose 5-phosphate isomerase RpiB
MRIALINEDSQASKNKIIYSVLLEEAKKAGHIVDNYGMYDEDDKHRLKYTQIGLIGSIIITSKAADFIVTGCGTGQGAMISMNSFPNIVCGYVANDLDAFLFGQINAGNAVSIPYAQYFGWGAEINLHNIFEKLFKYELGKGYPRDKAEAESLSREVIRQVKEVTCTPLSDILKKIDRSFLKSALDYPEFRELYFKNAQDKKISDYIKSVLDLD